MTRTTISSRYSVIALLAAGAMLGPTTCKESGDDGDAVNNDGNLTESEAIALCEEMVLAGCEKGFECEPDLAPILFQIENASECGALAKAECAEDDSVDTGDDDDGCQPTEMPTAKQIQDCIDAVENATCDELESLYLTGPCAEVEEMLECEDDTGGDGDVDGDTDADGDGDADTDADGDTDADTDGDVDTGDPPVEIQTDGCEAAVAQMCVIAESCADNLATVPALVETAIDNCASRMEDNTDAIAAACEQYLAEEVPNGTQPAVFLNGASAEEVEACMTGDNCSLATLTSLMDDVATFLASGDPTDMAAMVTPHIDPACLL